LKEQKSSLNLECPQTFLFRTFPHLEAAALAKAKDGKPSEAVKLCSGAVEQLIPRMGNPAPAANLQEICLETSWG
jgi:hypothetical protein